MAYLQDKTAVIPFCNEHPSQTQNCETSVCSRAAQHSVDSTFSMPIHSGQPLGPPHTDNCLVCFSRIQNFLPLCGFALGNIKYFYFKTSKSNVSRSEVNFYAEVVYTLDLLAEKKPQQLWSKCLYIYGKIAHSKIQRASSAAKLDNKLLTGAY